MTFETIVALNVTDEITYQDYRAAIAPLLGKFGGGFRYDFRVSQVLKSESHYDINRVFAIYFRDRTAADAFFTNPDYVAIKEQFFEQSVKSTTIIAAYDRPDN
jgi:uncharacterized protein (DUF1330 family)